MIYDILALLIVLASAAAGWMRGGARELVTLVSFTLSALISLFLAPYTGKIARGLVHPDWLGTVLAIVVVFLVAHIAIRAFGAWLSKKLQSADALGKIDRVGGLAFGIARALILLGVMHLIFAAIVPPERMPADFKRAAVYPISKAVAKTIQAVLPNWARMADRLTPAVEQSIRRGASDGPDSSPIYAEPGTSKAASASSRAYDDRDRARMDALVEKTR
jgi:membrane protein required for colicin V production